MFSEYCMPLKWLFFNGELMRFAFVTASSWFTASTMGGAEKQIYYLTTALARKGHHVDLYSMDIDKQVTKNGVNVIPAWDRKKGIRVIRYFTNRIPCLNKQLIEGNYDLIYTRGYSDYSFSLVRLLKRMATISVIGLAADTNISWKRWKQSFSNRKKWKDLFYWLRIMIYTKYTLRNANVIITQNNFQTKLASLYGQHVECLPNIYKPAEGPSSQFDSPCSEITWIGRLCPEKGVGYLLQTIDNMPDRCFVIIGRAVKQKQEMYSEKFSARKNVIYMEYVENKDIQAILSRTKLLLNTSPNEGFSNTYLEAWYAGVPVISLFANPSDLLLDEALGFCSNGDINLLMDSIKTRLRTDPVKSSEFACKAKAYVLTNHSEDIMITALENLVSNRKNYVE